MCVHICQEKVEAEKLGLLLESKKKLKTQKVGASPYSGMLGPEVGAVARDALSLFLRQTLKFQWT